jgi:sigma-B regulation protein RsbU (phosphoserine phosphatase)
MIDLPKGRLEYCNCGHNVPILDGKFLEVGNTNQPLGLWECKAFEGEVIEDIRNRQLLVYTDGLNEAENDRQERLGDERLLEAMQGTEQLTSEEVIRRLQVVVANHRAGAEPNDDLTLLCLSIRK